jgi:hypothetical protein
MSETTVLDTEAAYRVIPVDDGFSVEVITSDSHPITVSPFATATDAKVWIAEHRQRAPLETSESTSGETRNREIKRLCAR